MLALLRKLLTPGKPKALSNARIQAALRFGSEGEVSQIMRWLAGEAPTMGRWAYGVLNTPQTYRFITRERMPSGGYLITLLAVPELIDPPIPAAPEVVQLSFLDDPSMIPPLGHQDALEGGSSTSMRARRTDRRRQDAPACRSQRDQHEEIPKSQTQEEESARTPLFDRLMTQPGMNRALAQRIASSPIGTLADFETDLKIAQTFARSPFFFTVAKWRDGQRVVAPEVCHERPRSAVPARARRGSPKNRPERTADPAPQDDYAALIAEWQRTEPLGPIAMRVPGERRAAHGD